MKQRFKDEQHNKVYWLYSKLTPEQVENTFMPGNNWDFEFKMGYMNTKRTLPIKNTRLYAIRIAGKEWKKNNPDVRHPECKIKR